MKKTSIISSHITERQKDQIERFAKDAVRKAIRVIGLDNPSAQQVISHGDELANAIINKIRELSAFSQSVSPVDRFANEEVKSSYGYLSGYKKPKGITEQTNILRQLFPGIGFADEKLAEQPLPKNAEGWFAIPRWEKIAPTYGEAVQKVLDLIKKTRDGKFYNYREGQIDEKHLRQSKKSEKMFQKIGQNQKNYDILIIPAQFGINHRGRSVRRALEVMRASEFGLGAFAVGIMILTHPERLQNYDDLWIDCAGDEFSLKADGDFSWAPFFIFDGGDVEFCAGWVGGVLFFYGSASGFVL